MIQVETKQAVERIDELCAVPGIEGIFIGPADLSASLGVPGQTGHPAVFEAASNTIKAAKAHGKQVATAVGPQDTPFWIDNGVDLLFCTNDIAAMKVGAQAAMDAAQAALTHAAAAR